MPELPEVETVVRMHRAKLLGRTVAGVEFRWSRQAQPSPAAVTERLVGASIADVRRRAKFIVFELRRDAAAAGYLLIHLKMSGRLEWAAKTLRNRGTRASCSSSAAAIGSTSATRGNSAA